MKRIVMFVIGFMILCVGSTQAMARELVFAKVTKPVQIQTKYGSAYISSPVIVLEKVSDSWMVVAVSDENGYFAIRDLELTERVFGFIVEPGARGEWKIKGLKTQDGKVVVIEKQELFARTATTSVLRIRNEGDGPFPAPLVP